MVTIVGNIPIIPNEPTIPDESDTPAIPDNPCEPGTPNPTTPAIPNTPNVENPKPSGKPNTNTSSNNETKYTINNIIVEIPENTINEEIVLKAEDFALPEYLQNKFGNESEYYNIYFENKDSKRVNISSINPIKIKIKITELKEFIDVYEITEDNIIKPVDYVKNGDNIEIVTNSLGKYVISYKEIKTISPEVPATVKSKTLNHQFIWFITGISIIVIATGIYIIAKRNKSN